MKGSYEKPIVFELRFRPLRLEIGLKAQKLIAQGNTLGFGVIANNRPARAKALFTAITGHTILSLKHLAHYNSPL